MLKETDEQEARSLGASAQPVSLSNDELEAVAGGVASRARSEAYSIVNLVSDTGGQLGLWMGVSVITESDDPASDRP